MKSPLFGPVFWFDLVRTTRRGRYALLRCAYLALLLLALFQFYHTFSWGRGTRPALFEGGALGAHDLTAFAEGFFNVFMLVQVSAVLVLTPIYAAGAIAEEKERRTLEFLLASDLNSSEIVLGKLVSRLAHMMLLLLTGLPVLGLLQLLGGVDPDLVLAGFLLTGLTMLSLTSASLLISLYNATPWKATFRTYLATLAYLAVSALCPCPGTLFAPGNPLFILRRVQENDVPSERLLTSVAYAIVQLTITLICCLWSIRDLRLLALREPPRPWERPPVLDDLRLPRRRWTRLGDNPLLWKESNEAALSWWSGNEFLDSCALMMSSIGIMVFAGMVLLAVTARNDSLGESLQDTARFGATGVATFMLLLVAINAAGRFSREIERQTLDSLLSLPDRDGILWSKWRASIVYPGYLLWGVGAFWVIGLLSGGLNVLALPVVIGAWFCYAACLASLGLFFSLWTGSTVRATVLTILTAGVGMILFWMAVDYAQTFLGLKIPGQHAMNSVPDCLALPPCALWGLSFSSADVASPPWLVLWMVSSVGAAIYAWAAMHLWYATKAVFRRRYGPWQRRPQTLL